MLVAPTPLSNSAADSASGEEWTKNHPTGNTPTGNTPTGNTPTGNTLAATSGRPGQRGTPPSSASVHKEDEEEEEEEQPAESKDTDEHGDQNGVFPNEKAMDTQQQHLEEENTDAEWKESGVQHHEHVETHICYNTQDVHAAPGDLFSGNTACLRDSPLCAKCVPAIGCRRR